LSSFGAEVRLRRQRLGLSQDDLAGRANVDVKTLRSIENGRRTPRPSTVRLLAAVLTTDEAERERFCETAGRPAAQPPVPAQLPADVRGFTGRAAHLRTLDTLVQTPIGQPVVAAIGGTAGVGKTALAVHWAHRVADRFPDGQLYVNLRGFAPGDRPVPATEAVRDFLDALGVPPMRVPAGPDAQVALYRSLLAGRKMLILLDNARDTDQVRPLLPGSGGCLVLITSRRMLTPLVALEGANPVDVGLLTADESVALLGRRLGPERIVAEPYATDTIVQRCAGLPLALAIVAARAASHPHLPLATLAGELTEVTGLDALSGGDLSTDLRAVFSWSLRVVSAPAARLFRLASLHPGPELSRSAAASIVALTPREARSLLSELVAANLFVEPTTGRYSCHDLLRSYALDLAHGAETDAERAAATRRILDHYLHSAAYNASILDPHRRRTPLEAAAPGTTVARSRDSRQALVWFTAEHRAMLATACHAEASGLDRNAYQLVDSLFTYLQRQALLAERLVAGRIAVASAARMADPAAQAKAHRQLGGAYVALGRPAEAHAELQRALGFAAQADDLSGQAMAHFNLAYHWEQQNRHREGLAHAQHALRLYRAAGRRIGEARALNSCAWQQIHLDDPEGALANAKQALALFEELENPDGQAAGLDTIGYAYHRLGRHAEAIRCFERTLALLSNLGEPYNEADTLVHLGEAQTALGDAAGARTSWQRALDILTDLGHPDADQIRARPTRPASTV
jgi:tetratricopeptide (TPR) repeat protein/transcriptional regulator with XRE-family HTH domain